MPSYLSSTQAVGPSLVMISPASSAGDASMNLSGWNRRRLAEPRASSRASMAVWPMSPVNIPARLTVSIGRSKATAMAASRSPSRSPIRRSPDRILTTYLAVRGSHWASSSVNTAPLAAAPDASSIAANAAATSLRAGPSPGGGWLPFDRASTSATAIPRSDDRS